MVFQSYALYPHMTVYDNMAFSHAHRQGEQGRDRQAGAPGRRDPAADQLSRAPAQGDVGRPAPARRHRPRHRAQSEGLPVRRAAVEPRRGAARRDPHRDRQAQGIDAQHDDDLRHPRPGRGDDAGRPHRGAEGRQDRAGRLADGALPPPGQSVRGAVHRLAGHEHHARHHRQGGRPDGHRSVRPQDHPAGRDARRCRRAPRSASACARRI